MSLRDASFISSMVNCVAPYTGFSKLCQNLGLALRRGLLLSTGNLALKMQVWIPDSLTDLQPDFELWHGGAFVLMFTNTIIQIYLLSFTKIRMKRRKEIPCTRCAPRE